jgi:DegV family protein with EDD domain
MNMDSICILTDSSAQFPKPTFKGYKQVTILPLEVHLNGSALDNDNNMHADQLPRNANEKLHPTLKSPSIEKIHSLFVNLSQYYDTIIGIFLSSELNRCFQNAHEATLALSGKVEIHLIDSKTTSVGLGLLVQKAAEAVSDGINAVQVERMVRGLVPLTYSLICTQNLSYLYFNGFADQTQSIISEMLGLLPIFALEEGQITTVEKVKSHRHAISYFQEFLDEFTHLQHISFLQSAKPNFKDAKILQESVRNTFPEISFTKHIINLPLAALFGPRSIGLIVVESPTEQ